MLTSSVALPTGRSENMSSDATEMFILGNLQQVGFSLKQTFDSQDFWTQEPLIGILWALEIFFTSHWIVSSKSYIVAFVVFPIFDYLNVIGPSPCQSIKSFHHSNTSMSYLKISIDCLSPFHSVESRFTITMNEINVRSWGKWPGEQHLNVDWYPAGYCCCLPEEKGAKPKCENSKSLKD